MSLRWCVGVTVSIEYVGCFFCFKQKTAYEMRISDWSSDVCSSDLCAGNDMDPPLDTAIFGCATAVLADKTHGVRIVHHDHGVEFIGQVANGFQVGNNALHGKHTIGGNQLVACASGIGRLQLCPQTGPIVIGLALAPVLPPAETARETRIA